MGESCSSNAITLATAARSERQLDGVGTTVARLK
jgi:hypothetical protein